MSGREFSEEEKHVLRAMLEKERWRYENKQMMKEGNNFSECCWPLITVIVIVLLIAIIVGGFGFVRGHWEYFFHSSSR